MKFGDILKQKREERRMTQNDFVNITLHDYLKKSSFFGPPPIFTERSGVNIGGGPDAGPKRSRSRV